MATATHDILWHNSDSGETKAWITDKNRVARQATVLSETGSALLVGAPWRIAGSGDFDGNGKSDILWVNASDGAIQIWFMDGHRVVRRDSVSPRDGTPLLVRSPWSIVGVGDFSGDGRSDILCHNTASGEAKIWHMIGNKVAHQATVLSETGNALLVGAPWRIAGVGDFDADGNSDILWHNTSDGATQIWFMNGNQVIRRTGIVSETGSAMLVGAPWSIVGVGDFSGDARSDILWVNASDGAIQIWTMDGKRIAQRSALLGEAGKPEHSGAPWSIVGTSAAPRVWGEIGRRYSELGGPSGWLGSTLAREEDMDEGGRVGRFQHGEIYWWPDTGAIEINYVVVHYSGLICFGETDSDGGSSADEPYVQLGVVAPGTTPLATRTQIYTDVDAREARPDWIEIYRGKPVGVSINSVLMEYDFGDPDKFKEQVRAVVDAASRGIVTGVGVIPYVGPWLAGAAGPLLKDAGPQIVDALNDLLGFGDDYLGSNTTHVSAKQMIILAKRAEKSWSQGVGYNLETPLFSADGASYKAYFAFNPG